MSENKCDHHHDDKVVEVGSSESFIANHVCEFSALHFPCHFPIKVFGCSEDYFLQHAYDLVSRHAPELTLDQCSVRKSSKGRYMSVTLNITAVSRPQLDSIYADLKADNRVLSML